SRSGVLRDQPREIQDARVRDLSLLCRRRRIAVRDRECLRQSRRLPDHPLRLPRRRPGGRRARAALRDDRRCRPDLFLAEPRRRGCALAQPPACLEPRPAETRDPECRVRDRADRRDGAAPDRRRRPGATALWAANNSAIHSVLGEQVGVRVFVVCAAVAVMAVASAGARPVATPGVSSDEIHIGSSVPLSGEAAIAGTVARGIDAYFKYVNDKGGVLGRKLTYTYLDDGYDPGRAVNNTIRLTQQEEVFQAFSSLGANNNP